MITCNQHLGNSIKKRLLFLKIKGFQNCQIPLIRSKEKKSTINTTVALKRFSLPQNLKLHKQHSTLCSALK